MWFTLPGFASLLYAEEAVMRSLYERKPMHLVGSVRITIF